MTRPSRIWPPSWMTSATRSARTTKLSSRRASTVANNMTATSTNVPTICDGVRRPTAATPVVQPEAGRDRIEADPGQQVRHEAGDQPPTT